MVQPALSKAGKRATPSGYMRVLSADKKGTIPVPFFFVYNVLTYIHKK
jgi:hypothetical protein